MTLAKSDVERLMKRFQIGVGGRNALPANYADDEDTLALARALGLTS